MPEPYPVAVADGVFRFTTSQAIHYPARFLKMLLPADIQLPADFLNSFTTCGLKVRVTAVLF